MTVICIYRWRIGKHGNDEDLRTPHRRVSVQLVQLCWRRRSRHLADDPSNIRVVRVMCSGRVSPELVVRTFREGADGVMVLG